MYNDKLAQESEKLRRLADHVNCICPEHLCVRRKNLTGEYQCHLCDLGPGQLMEFGSPNANDIAEFTDFANDPGLAYVD